MKISLIAALSENRAIGKDNKLIWHIPQDLKRFKETTSGHPVIMGRKTYESIGRHLPDRLNIIITREKNYNPHKFSNCANCDDFRIKICNSLEEAIEIAGKEPSLRSSSAGEAISNQDRHGQAKLDLAMTKNEEEIFIIGGGQIFEQAIKIADKLYLTIIEGEFEGDTFFPDYSDFKKVSESETFKYHGLKYKFLELEK